MSRITDLVQGVDLMKAYTLALTKGVLIGQSDLRAAVDFYDWLKANAEQADEIV